MSGTPPDRLERIVVQAVNLFGGDEEAASHWLRTPCRALGEKTPLEIASTEESAREVESLIGRLQHGVFT